MGAQTRPFLTPDHDAAKSLSIMSPTSPASRKRRFTDVVLVGSEDDAADEAELTQRVSFKRSKSGENDLTVVVHSESPRDSCSLEPVTPTATSDDDAEAKASPSSKTAARPNMSASQTITLDMLRPHFEKPLAQVAQVFGICVTLLKKICRKNGLARWPHRQIIGLRKSIASMEQAIGHFEGARRESYALQLEKQLNKLAALLEDPTKCNLLAVDDEYLPTHQHMDEASHSPMLPPPAPYYTSYAPPAAVYERAYPAYADYYRAPPPMQHVSYAPQHYYSTSYPQAAVPVSYHAAHSAPYPAASLSLPPLRTDSRPALPSLAVLMGRRW